MNTVIADNIKNIIAEKGLKQGFVAEKAGLSPTDLSNMLNGRKIIRDDNIIISWLSATPNELFGMGN